MAGIITLIGDPAVVHYELCVELCALNQIKLYSLKKKDDQAPWSAGQLFWCENCNVLVEIELVWQASAKSKHWQC